MIHQEVLKLYRTIMKTIRQIPDKQDRDYMRDWAKADFRANKDIKDEVSFQNVKLYTSFFTFTLNYLSDSFAFTVRDKIADSSRRKFAARAKKKLEPDEVTTLWTTLWLCLNLADFTVHPFACNRCQWRLHGRTLLNRRRIKFVSLFILLTAIY